MTKPEIPKQARVSALVSEELRDRLYSEAEIRGMSPTFLVRKAVEQFMDNLLPASEFRLTVGGPTLVADASEDAIELPRVVGE